MEEDNEKIERKSKRLRTDITPFLRIWASVPFSKMRLREIVQKDIK